MGIGKSYCCFVLGIRLWQGDNNAKVIFVEQSDFFLRASQGDADIVE